MFRNVVLFKWRQGTTQHEIGAMHRRTELLVAQCPTVLALEVADDIGTADTNHNLAVTIDFDDEAGWLAYHYSEPHLTSAAKNASMSEPGGMARLRHDHQGRPGHDAGCPIRHIALYRWTEGTTRDTRQAVLGNVRTIGTSHPAIKQLRISEGRKGRPEYDGDFDWMIHACFSDIDAYAAFQGSPTYTELQREISRAANRSATLHLGREIIHRR